MHTALVQYSTIYEWGDRNKMQLNLNKCHVITFTGKRNWLAYSYTVASVELTRVNKIVDLGVLLTSTMNFNHHIGYTVSKARSVLGIIKRFSKQFNDINVARTLFCSLVRSKLEYAAVVWNPYHIIYSNLLESVQKQFLIFVLPDDRADNSFRRSPYHQRR